MNLALPPGIRQLIDDRVRSGKYKSAEDVVAAALAHLEQHEQIGDFEDVELDRLLAEGERSGEALDGNEVFKELGTHLSS